MIQTLQKYSPEDMPFATEEDFDQIEWPQKEEYQQLLDEFKNKEIGTVKILKKHEDDVQIHPSQQEVFTAEASQLEIAFSMISCLSSNTASSVGWYVDSGASRHMTYDRKLFNKFQEQEG
jgi:hypothetical protein